MGYTHYWDNAGFTPHQWKEACTNAKLIIRASDVPVQWEYDDNRKPEISRRCIRFNGVDGDGHETFYIDRQRSSGFCKTAREPYDEIVVAILIMLVKVSEEFGWTSDGSGPDFADGIALYERAMDGGG